MILLAVVLALVFIALALLHIYWGLGGQWARAAAIPKDQNGHAVMSPGLTDCLTVAAGLLAFAYICLVYASLLPSPFSDQIIRVGLWIVFGIFSIRAVGDFRLVGFTRRVVGTDFAKYDRLIYTPLCLVIAAGLLCLILIGLVEE